MDFNPSEEPMKGLAGTTNMEFETVPEQPAKIKVIGVGGGGGNAVNHMYRQGIKGVDFIVCNTDAKALRSSPVPTKIEIGKLGAGNVPERARLAALEHKEEIRAAISDDTQMLFITAGMGGGTGTGAAPVIAEIAKSIELDDEMVPRILVVAIVTMPFCFEGKVRKNQALAGIEELKKHVDAILVINNDKLRDLFGNLTFSQAFSQADDVLLTAAKGIAEIITVSGYVNIDFRDVNTVMENSGTALMGAGLGRGDNRARQAIEAATTSVLLNDNDIRGAQNILLYFSYSPSHQITMDEIGEVTDYLTNLIGNTDANIIWGNAEDENLNDELSITLIATGFEQKEGPTVYNLDGRRQQQDGMTTNAHTNVADMPQQASTATDVPTAQTAAVTETKEPVDENGMQIIHRTAALAVEAKKESPMPADADPFSVPEATAATAARRVFVLEETAEDEAEEAVEALAETQFTSQTTPASNYLDEIRIVAGSKSSAADPLNETAHTNSEAPKAAAEIGKPAIASTFGPMQSIEKEQKAERNDQSLPFETQKSTEAIVSQQVAQAFTPTSELDDLKIREKAERIRRMNELLHNHPNGPKMVEDMNVEQLQEAAFDIQHSADEAHRTVINAEGRMTRGFSFLKDLPD